MVPFFLCAFVCSLPEGEPDFSSCLIHQKLQMLNCCIKAKQKPKSGVKRKSEESSSLNSKLGTGGDSFVTPYSSFSVLPSASSSGTVTHFKTVPERQDKSTSEEEEEDDEFFEAQEEFTSRGSSEAKGEDPEEDKVEEQILVFQEVVKEGGTEEESLDPIRYLREGVLRQCDDLVMLYSSHPLCVPVTQDPGPMTEDMLLEQERVLSNLGTTEEAAKIRAKLQSASLLSDMQAFKVQ